MGHALFPHAEALHQAAGFLAGWAAFLDLLNAALTGRPVCDVYEALIPSADAQAARLGRVVAGTCELAWCATSGPSGQRRTPCGSY